MTKKLPRRRLAAVALVAAMALGAVGYAVIEGQLRADSEATRADEAIAAAEDLCDQVERAGGLCVVDPSELPGEPGEAGPRGEPGRGVDSAQCVGGTWTVHYSDGDVDYNAGPCTGDTGPSGKDGTDGEDGAAGEDGTAGEPGPPGADGEDGEPGPPGVDGTDGRGITDAQCDPATGRWRIEYDDGTADDDAGPCVWQPGN